MKSGHCLIKNDEELKSIESEFDAKGRVQGFVKIDYFNNTRVLGKVIIEKSWGGRFLWNRN